jgi:hypothetical protein
LEKEIAILNELWKKYEDVIKENCPKENPAIFQNMSDAERILDKKLEPEWLWSC